MLLGEYKVVLPDQVSQRWKLMTRRQILGRRKQIFPPQDGVYPPVWWMGKSMQLGGTEEWYLSRSLNSRSVRSSECSCKQCIQTDIGLNLLRGVTGAFLANQCAKCMPIWNDFYVVYQEAGRLMSTTKGLNCLEGETCIKVYSLIYCSSAK